MWARGATAVCPRGGSVQEEQLEGANRYARSTSPRAHDHSLHTHQGCWNRKQIRRLTCFLAQTIVFRRGMICPPSVTYLHKPPQIALSCLQELSSNKFASLHARARGCRIHGGVMDGFIIKSTACSHEKIPMNTRVRTHAHSHTHTHTHLDKRATFV